MFVNSSDHYNELEVFDIKAQNSIDFLEAAFDCYRSQQIFSISRADTTLDGKVGRIETLQLPDLPRLGWTSPNYVPLLSGNAAQIVFTSGTEGPPKAVVLSHRNLADVVIRLNDVMKLTEEVREYIGVPVTYSFGLGRARAVGAVGGSLFLPDRFDPMEIGRMLAEGEINAISAVPSLWRLILANPGTIGTAGRRVRWIEIGSQFMAEDDKVAMRALFPEARIVQHYGLTEASRSTFLDISATEDSALGSVGRAVGSTELRIEPDGAIAIRGDHVAMGRLEEEGRIVPLTDADGWLVTRDRGELRDGDLWYLGRLDDQINIGGLKIGAEALEASIVSLVPGAADRFAVTAIPDAARGEVVLLAYETGHDDYAALIETAARVALAKRGIEAAGALRILVVSALPRTGTNKIRRNALRDLWSARADSDPSIRSCADTTDRSVLSETETRVAESWQKVIGSVALTSELGFYDVGGDSLSSVQVGLVMEGEGWPRTVVRATFEGRPLSEVARLAQDHLVHAEVPSGMPGDDGDAAKNRELPDRTIRNWSVSLARGFMVLSVLLSHWGPGLFNRLGLERQAETWLSVIYRAGTPGFATIFGLGIGYFMLPNFIDNQASVFARLRLSFRLVMIGVILLAVVHLLRNEMEGMERGAAQVALTFYGVLAYYAIMLGTARLWLPALARLRNPMAVLIAAVPILWLVWQGAVAIVPAVEQNNALEWVRLMIAAGGYNIFKMTMVAAAGAALGLWISHQRDTLVMADRLILLGSAGSALCLFSMGELNGFATLGDRDNFAFTSVSGQMFYVSLAAFLIGVGLRLVSNWSNLGRIARLPIKALIVTGGLALPIYVFHGLVLPMRDVLSLSGLPKIVVLAIPMALFIGVILYGGRRLSRMYFG